MQPGIFVSELDPIANSKINVHIRGVGNGLIAIEERHVPKIDFPIQIARRARIIGVIRRSTLGER